MMENLTPVFSCVIPTKGRVDLVSELLKSLRSANKVNGIPIEIVVIDNSSSSDAIAIEQLCDQYDAVFIAGPPSVREKRNMGIEQSHGEYVFFIDSDCIADKHIFERHYEVLTEANHSACIGVTQFVGKNNFIWHVISNTRFLDSFSFPVLLKDKVESAPWGPTTNLSVKRDVLVQLNGFETNLPFNLGADDADLGLRINEAGYKIGMAEDAIVYHSRETWNGWKKILSRVFRWGKMDYHLYYQRHMDKTALTMPKAITIFLMTLLTHLLLAVVTSNYYLMTAIAIWPLLYLIFFALIKKRHWKMNSVPLRVLMGAEFINQVFDLGCLLMSWRHWSFRCLYCEPIDDPRTIWHTKMHSIWALCFVSLSIIIMDCVWLVFL